MKCSFSACILEATNVLTDDLNAFDDICLILNVRNIKNA